MRRDHPPMWMMSLLQISRQGLSVRKEEEPTGSSAPLTEVRVHATTLTLTSPSARRAHREHPFEDLHRLLHFVHRPERDAAVCLLERREIAADAHLQRGTRLTELARGPLQVDEDAVCV